MAATVTREFMFQQMVGRKLPYWMVTDGRDTIAENMEEQSVAKSQEMLEEVMSNVLDTFIIVKLSDRTKQERAKGGNTKTDYLEYKIQLRGSPSMGGIGGNSMVGDLLNEVKQLQQKNHELQITQLTENMKREMKELKEKLESKDPMSEMALKVISGLFDKDKATVGIAGSEHETVNETEVEKQKKIRAALIRLAKIDKDIANTLTLLADFAENNPEKYHAFIPMLK